MRKRTLVKNILYAIDQDMIFPEKCEYRRTDETLDDYIKYDYPIEKAILFLKSVYKTWMYKINVKYENLGKGYINIYVRRIDKFACQCFCMNFRVNIDSWGYNTVLDQLSYGVIESKNI